MKNCVDEKAAASRKAKFGVRKSLWAALVLAMALAGVNSLNPISATRIENLDMFSPPPAAEQTASLRDGYFRSGQWRADLLTLASAVRFLMTS